MASRCPYCKRPDSRDAELRARLAAAEKRLQDADGLLRELLEALQACEWPLKVNDGPDWIDNVVARTEAWLRGESEPGG